MAAPQLVSTRTYGLQHSRMQLRRDSLGGSASGVPVISYTSASSKKRPFVEDNDTTILGKMPSSPAKRNRVALKDSNIVLRSDGSNVDFSQGMKKTVLGEKKAVGTVKKGVRGLSDMKVRSLKPVIGKKIISTKTRALATTSPAPQGVTRKSTTLSRHLPAKPNVLRHQALKNARGIYSSSPLRIASSPSDESEAVSTAAPIVEVPESWKFDIYEDSHEETMQNLMEHSATVLDISDESEDEKWSDDEVAQKGKENISPERLKELMAGVARDRMQLDTKECPALQEKRPVLGELEIEKLYPKEKEEKEEKETRPTLNFENIPSLETPSSCGLGKGAEFELWASAGETDDESDGEAGLPSTPPKGLQKKVKIVEDEQVDESASECGGASDKEN